MRTTTLLMIYLRISTFIFNWMPVFEPRLLLLFFSSPFKVSRNPTNLGVLNGLSIYHKPRKVHVTMDHGRMILFFYKVATLVKNLLISSLGLYTKDGSYLDNIVNFKEYSSTLILPYLRLMNSSTFNSLFSRGKHFHKKVSLNSPHYIGPNSAGLLFFNCV